MDQGFGFRVQGLDFASIEGDPSKGYRGCIFQKVIGIWTRCRVAKNREADPGVGALKED